MKTLLCKTKFNEGKILNPKKNFFNNYKIFKEVQHHSLYKTNLNDENIKNRDISKYIKEQD